MSNVQNTISPKSAAHVNGSHMIGSCALYFLLFSIKTLKKSNHPICTNSCFEVKHNFKTSIDDYYYYLSIPFSLKLYNTQLE